MYPYGYTRCFIDNPYFAISLLKLQSKDKRENTIPRTNNIKIIFHIYHTMADKTTILKSFNEHFFEFLDDVIGIINPNDDIKMAKQFFQTVRNLNPTSILKCWHYYVYMPYKDAIDSGDISYFLNKDYADDLVPLGGDVSEIMDAIDKLRIPIRNMKESNIAICAEYIQNLSTLAQMYILSK